jgi:hypothetical protein
MARLTVLTYSTRDPFCAPEESTPLTGFNFDFAVPGGALGPGSSGSATATPSSADEEINSRRPPLVENLPPSHAHAPTVVETEQIGQLCVVDNAAEAIGPVTARKGIYVIHSTESVDRARRRVNPIQSMTG